MDRLGSGIPLDPTTGTRSAGATEFVLGGEGRGQSWGVEIIFLHLGGRRGGEVLGSGVLWGGREEVTWVARRALRARGASSVAPPPPRGAGGVGGRGVKMAAGR